MHCRVSKSVITDFQLELNKLNNGKVHADRLKVNSLVGRCKSKVAESFQHLFQGRSFKPLKEAEEPN